MYEATTEDVTIKVHPIYLDEQSLLENNHFVWAYHIIITNNNTAPVQLRARHWIITDANGHTEQVQGPGVVGEQPTISPSASFAYTSGVVLKTTSGIMHGTYTMVRLVDGSTFEARIPAFSLDSGIGRKSLN